MLIGKCQKVSLSFKVFTKNYSENDDDGKNDNDKKTDVNL